MRPVIRDTLSRQFAPIIVALTLVPLVADAAGFIKFDGINGTSADPGHVGWIDITETGWGDKKLSKKITELSLTTRFSSISPKLAEATAKGKVFAFVIIEQLPSGQGSGKPQIYRLENVLITAYSVSSAIGSNSPLERLTLSFENLQALRPDREK
jgi:type VI protein secretion system component Hcp